MPTLESLLAAAAADLEGIEARQEGPATTWSRSGRVFAVLEGDAVELRLDEAVAAAATRTPDTRTSSRGPEWVRFSPKTLDDHAIDRLEAWFALAARRAVG
jgi:2,4-dienoyl-CoA reductase-like NADH-dependent reductase (Old Yellow Enzyme family)